MENEKNLEKAIRIYRLVCETIEEMGWEYTTDEEGLTINTSVTGEDLTIEMYVSIEPDIQIIRIDSRIPVTFPKDMLTEAAVAVNEINNRLVNGFFHFDFNTGKVDFRFTGSFFDSLISKGYIEHMLISSASIVDDFNDKLFMLAKKMMTLKQFMEFISNLGR